MITQREIRKCWRPEDVITLLTQKRQQLIEELDKGIILNRFEKPVVFKIVREVLGVEGEK